MSPEETERSRDIQAAYDEFFPVPETRPKGLVPILLPPPSMDPDSIAASHFDQMNDELYEP